MGFCKWICVSGFSQVDFVSGFCRWVIASGLMQVGLYKYLMAPIVYRVSKKSRLKLGYTDVFIFTPIITGISSEN